MKTTYPDMPLAPELQTALAHMKFIEPTSIQEECIPHGLEGKDIVACAETGSGKTAAFVIPMVQQMLTDETKNGLILAPTRELAHQIADFIRDLTHDCAGYWVVSIVGGMCMKKQLQQLRNRPRIIVATPGRLNDHLNRRRSMLKQTHFLVLDEGDRLLDMGFAPQLDQILKCLPEQRQTALFTATLERKVRQLADAYLSDPIQVDVGRVSLPVAAIKQSIATVGMKDKEAYLMEELDKREGSIIVFVKSKHRTDKLARNLKNAGFTVDLIHGDRSQGQRTRAIQDFKKGRSRILCATDIAARGIDVPQVAHVINFDLPRADEDYVHRIGRTARNGAEGEALSFVMPDEHAKWNNLMKTYKITGIEKLNERMKNTKPAHARKPRRKPESRSGLRNDGRERTQREKGAYDSAEGRSSENRKDHRKSFFTEKPRDDRRSDSRDDRPKRSFGDKPRFDKPRGDRDDRKSFADKPSFDRKPRGDRDDSRSDRPKRSFGDKPSFDRKRSDSRDDRPRRSFGDKPRFDKPRSDRDDRKSFGDKPKRSWSDKPRSDSRDDRPKRSFGDKPRFDKRSDSRDDRPKRSFGDKPRFDQKRGDDRKPFGDRPRRDDRNSEGSSEKKSYAKTNFGQKRFNAKKKDIDSMRPLNRSKKAWSSENGDGEQKKSFGKKPFGKRPAGRPLSVKRKSTGAKNPAFSGSGMLKRKRPESDGASSLRSS